MSSPPLVFDRQILSQRRARALPGLQDYDFLLQRAGYSLQDRLEDIPRAFPTALEIGSRTPAAVRQGWESASRIIDLLVMDLITPHVTDHAVFRGDEEMLPFQDGTLDLVISNLCLHSVNDLPGALVQIRRALKPDGLFLASMFGGETLWQLKQAFAHAETTLKNGLSPRVFPFADKQQMGGLLQRAGFSLPVVDSEILTVTYPHLFKLMADLRGMGEGNIIAARSKHNPGKAFFETAAQFYQEHFAGPDGKIEATFEIIFLIGWAPHDSQQKPLRPGSAKTSLAEALGTTEISTGEKVGS